MKLLEININRKDNYIKFKTTEPLKLDDLIYLDGLKKYYYEVTNIYLNNENSNTFIVTAKPAGYYNKLEKEKGDIRYLFNSPIIKELNSEVINKIREESRYL